MNWLARLNMHQKLVLLAAAWLFMIGMLVFVIISIRMPVKPCKKLVAHSSTCIPFGCSKTYVNPKGEDTGECG